VYDAAGYTQCKQAWSPWPVRMQCYYRRWGHRPDNWEISWRRRRSDRMNTSWRQGRNYLAASYSHAKYLFLRIWFLHITPLWNAFLSSLLNKLSNIRQLKAYIPKVNVMWACNCFSFPTPLFSVDGKEYTLTRNTDLTMTSNGNWSKQCRQSVFRLCY